MIIAELKEDIEAGKSKTEELRIELMTTLETLFEDAERKHGR